jgi:hypothetical protein
VSFNCYLPAACTPLTHVVSTAMKFQQAPACTGTTHSCCGRHCCVTDLYRLMPQNPDRSVTALICLSYSRPGTSDIGRCFHAFRWDLVTLLHELPRAWQKQLASGSPGTDNTSAISQVTTSQDTRSTGDDGDIDVRVRNTGDTACRVLVSVPDCVPSHVCMLHSSS